MTNSHNRSGKHGSQAERYFNNHSPQQCGGSSGKRNNSTSNNSGGNGGRGQKSPSSTYFRSISTSNAIPIIKSSSPVSSKGSNCYVSNSPSGRPHSFNINTSYQRSSPGGGNFNNHVGSLPGSPPNFSHFAGSKCYDAPAPTALPKPPVHWTSSVSSITTAALNTSASSTSKPISVSGVAKNTNCKSSIVLSPSSSASRVKVRSVKPAMSCAAAAAKANRNADFSNNLKMILNVQA
ncbi:probable ATP-dependent RNA helicase ddx17 [Sabethes cyaneus]|uniref:probable ATP-dependent RNA helicase ddx17 n=1 Tax=Sabethes cyaneus TaxID=53552 RepID=UPI00237D6E53|nr:probable ATP-dependent RNA helicase ddx17 [Sabethes cyaneus]XP_053695091.1 probable ATP-dependent RNA helicase ddx17 [Sabethes cyaneus]XP_053695092.1 probable ATP-dependent RNA helicase ddx17 [Sabethes cyaneus]